MTSPKPAAAVPTILGRKVTTVTPGERRCTVDFGALEAGYAYISNLDGSAHPPFNWWIKVRAHEHRGAPIDGSERTEPEAIEAIGRALLAMRDAIPGRQREPAAAVDLETLHSLLQSLDAAKLADNGVVIERATLAALIAELEQLRNVEDALIFLDAHTVNYCDAAGFLDECRELGWEPGAGAARIAEDSVPSPPEAVKL